MLFLLKDHEGRALLITDTCSKAVADTFGRAHLLAFSGESIEIDAASRGEAEEFWGVRTVTLRKDTSGPRDANGWTTTTQIWVRGPVLPDDVEADGLLTAEDRRDITLDHIARTSALVAHVTVCLT